MSQNPDTCPHEDFAVQAQVERIQLPNGSTGAMVLHVNLSCTICGAPFWFPGLGTGRSFTEPVTTPDGFMATMPVVQEGRRCTPDPSLASTLIRTNDVHKGHRKAS